jgi:CDP-paratose 2-epimerase
MSKRCSELLALEYAEAFGFPVWINRCGVLAGPGQFGRPDQGIFSYWIRSWRERRPLRYIGFDGLGSQVRDCLDPRDLVELIARQMRGETPNSFGGMDHRICNFSGGRSSAVSLNQLSAWCSRRFGPHEVSSEPRPRPYDLPWIVLDSRRAEALWGWRPKRTTDQICSDIADALDGIAGERA